MRIGFIAHPTEEDFEFAALKAFPCVEFIFSDDLAALQRASEIRTWRQKFEVEISHVALFGRDYLTEDAAERQRHFTDLRAVTDFAKAIGAPLVTTGGGQGGRTPEERAQRALELFPPAVRHAEGLGLRFAFYNCHWANWVTGPDAWERLLPAMPTVGIKFDPSHPLHAGEDWVAQLAQWGSRVYHTHAKDTLFVDGKPFEDVPAGLGDIEWGKFFALLYHHGYQGDINIEPHSKTWDGERRFGGILLARQHLQQFVAPPANATLKDFPGRF